MSRRDKNNGAPMSFFSFQDIISCITGIMVLVTLLLALELTMRSPGEPELETKPQNEELAQRLERAKARREELRKQLAEGRAILDKAGNEDPITREQVEAVRKAVAALTANVESVGNQVPQAERDKTDRQRELAGVEKELAELQEWLRQSRENVEKRKKQPKVTLVRGQGRSRKPLFVECSAGDVRVAEISEEGATAGVAAELVHWSGQDAYAKFLEWASKRDKAEECFVLLTRPDAVEDWKKVAAQLKNGWGFDTGWDVWPTEKSLFGQ